MQNTQHAHLPPNGGVGKSYTRYTFNSSEHLILGINLFWHAHVHTTLPNIYTAPPTNPHHTCGVPKQICLAVTQEVCLAAHICFAENTTTENTLTCLQDLEEGKQKGEGSSQKGKKAQATAKAPALQNLEGALKTAIQGKGKGKAARPASTPKQRPKPGPALPPPAIVQERDEDEDDDKPLSQRKEALAHQLKVAAYNTAAQGVLPPGLGLPPPNAGTTTLDLSAQGQPDSELGGTAVPDPLAQGTGQETQPDPLQQNLFDLDPQPDYYTLGEHGLPAPETIQDGHCFIKISLEGNTIKYTNEQVKTNLIILAERLGKATGDMIIHGRPTGFWTVWLKHEFAEELIFDKEIDMYDLGGTPSFQTFYVRPLDLHGDELPRKPDPEKNADYEDQKEQRQASRAQKREAEKARTVRYFVDAPKASMPFPDADTIESIKANALKTNEPNIERINIINALDEYGERSTTYVVFILQAEGAELDLSKLKYSSAVIRGRFYMVKARFSKKDLPDVKACCWTSRCAGPATCTAHSEAKARLDPPWEGGSQRGSQMSQSEVRIAAGRDRKATQFDKATALAEVSRPLCIRWWEGPPPPTPLTQHTSHNHTTRHTNTTHAHPRLVLSSRELHSQTRDQRAVACEGHHVRLSAGGLGLEVPAHDYHLPARGPHGQVERWTDTRDLALAERTTSPRVEGPDTTPARGAQGASEHARETLSRQPRQMPRIIPGAKELATPLDVRRHAVTHPARPADTRVHEPTRTRRPPVLDTWHNPATKRKVRNTKRNIACKSHNKTITLVLQCKWSHLRGHILAPSRLPRWVHQSVT
jgi:hypothetical protein